MKSNHVCGECASFPICSKTNVKNVEKTTDSCMWEIDLFTKREKKDD